MTVSYRKLDGNETNFVEESCCTAASEVAYPMNALRKVLVVDNGRRGDGDLLSSELAELGVSSVTTSFEAADDVLGLIERPSAIFLKMPLSRNVSERASFIQLARTLRASERTSGIPVIEWDQDALLPAGGVSEILRSEIGPQAVAGPEL